MGHYELGHNAVTMPDSRELFWTIFAAVLTALVGAVILGFGLVLVVFGPDTWRQAGPVLIALVLIVTAASLMRAR
jgi:hypothetical protein